jgi:hypothetical protein
MFEPTVEDLSDKMLAMLEHRDRWDSMGRRGLADMQPHDMPAVLAQIEDLYREMVETKRRSLVTGHTG